MFLRILLILAPVFVCLLVGMIWTRTGRPFETRFVTRLIMNVGAPFLIISSFNNSKLHREALAEVGLAIVAVSVIVSVAVVIVLRLLRADFRTYFGPLVFWNSGNIGIPVCLFAFGQEGLSLAVVVFMWVIMLNFTIGVALVSGEYQLGRLLRMPFIYAIVISVTLAWSGYKLPVWLGDTADLLGALTIPMMLLSLGASLTSLRPTVISRAAGFAALRFGLGFGAGVLVVGLLGLTGVVRGVVVLQATMPSAVFNYMIAARYERNAQEVASIVVVTTTLSFFVLPFVLWFVLR